MSRGPGKIERAIDAIFRDRPDNAYSVEDLIDSIYSGVNRIEKKHRVSIIRAAKSVCAKSPDWTWYISEIRGGPLVFFHYYNAHSYTAARLKADFLNGYRHKDTRRPWTTTSDHDIRAMMEPGGKYYDYVKEGGAWWRHVQLRIAERDGLPADDLKAEQEKANRRAELARVGLSSLLKK